ncbi:MAG: DUF5678 domain-containing protein [Euryarchaeota archaeon]|nr:DUF5678 domain-containing protein [Euryarchaeota archaeon]
MVLDAIDRDFIAYKQMEKKLLKKYYGKIAVFCDGKLVAVGEDIKEAVKKARTVSKGKELFVKELFRPDEQTKAIL